MEKALAAMGFRFGKAACSRLTVAGVTLASFFLIIVPALRAWLA